MRNKRLIILFSVLLAITLLVVFNSVLFSVQHVYASCANVENSEYESLVLGSHKIKRGTSIFFVDKDKVVKNIENASERRVKVLNVEKSFPNRIYINYVEVKAYAYVENGADKYYLGNDMTVMAPKEGEKAIQLILGCEVGKFNYGDSFTCTTQSGINSTEVLAQILNGLERCGYMHNDVVDLIKSINLSGKFIKIETSTGLVIEIINAQSLAQKIRLAVSVYYNSDKIDKGKGTLIITGEKTASYRNWQGEVTDV